MSRKQRERRETAAGEKATSSKLLRWLLPVLVGLAGVALGVNVYWWYYRPRLEPLPVVEDEFLEPAVRKVIELALADVKANDFSAMAWGDLGAVLHAHGKIDSAQPCYRNAEQLDEKDYRWPYLLGVSLAPQDAEQALACFRRAAERCGDKPHVQLRLAEMLMERQLNAEAAEHVEKALLDDPSSARGQLAKARLLMAEGKLPEAKKWAEKSAAGVDNLREPHRVLAEVCRRTGDKEREAEELELLQTIPDRAAVWGDPDVAAVWVLRQDTKARQAKEAVAAQASAPAPIADRSENSAAILLARNYYKTKQFAAAEEVLRTTLKKFPSDDRLHHEVGVACFQQKKYGMAAQEFSRAIELNPNLADAHYNLGHALLKLNQPIQARASFATAVRLEPSHAYARINLGDLLLQAGDTKGAVEQLKYALKLVPGDHRASELLNKARPTTKE